MKPIEFLSEIKKHQALTDASDADLRRITGWSQSTMRRRFQHPEQITLGEAEAISTYLGIKAT